MSQETYKKEVNRGAFIVERAPVSVVSILSGFCVFIALVLVSHFLFEDDFNVRDYLLRKSLFLELVVPFVVACVVDFLIERKIYCLMKEKPFAAITNDKLILDFGKHALSWDSIQSVRIEGERKLTVVHGDRKRKKRVCDLKWLSRKKEFINGVKNGCKTRSIPFQENEMTLSSRLLLFLETAKQALFE